MTGRILPLLAAALALAAVHAWRTCDRPRAHAGPPALHLVRRDPLERQILADLRDCRGDYRTAVPRRRWARTHRRR